MGDDPYHQYRSLLYRRCNTSSSLGDVMDKSCSLPNKATWVNGKRKQTGLWEYSPTGGFFTIYLDSKDPVTGEPRTFRSYEDTPEWGNWKRVATND